MNLARNRPEVKWINRGVYIEEITFDPLDLRITSNTDGTTLQLKRLISGSKILFDARKLPETKWINNNSRFHVSFKSQSGSKSSFETK